ncbi:MAG TPA: hypothetical protein DCY20_10565 [Firmicutes bacterium]|nr:hypothetical protein [Bacillota bacterium]
MGFMADVFTNRQLVNLGIGISFIGSILFLVPSNPLIYGLGILLIGLGFAPIYPCLMHETSARYNSEQAKKIISQQVAISYLSLLVFVPILGWVATHTFLEIIAFITIGCVIALHAVVKKLNQLT